MSDMENLEYVFAERLPSGNVRYRFRRYGKKTTIKGKPGEPEFHRHYSELLDGIGHTAASARARTVEGSIAWLVGEYLRLMEVRVGAGITSPLHLKAERHHLGKLVTAYGEYDLNLPRKKFLELLNGMMATPGAARNFKKSVGRLYGWAIKQEHTREGYQTPTLKIDPIKTKEGGFPEWTRDDFAAYFAAHKPGTMARRAILLAISTTARRGDIIRLGRQHEVTIDGRKWLRWKQAKAPGRIVELPMSRNLLAEVEGHPDLTYLLTAYGHPFTHGGFGERFRKWCDEAGISKSLHGVRKGVSSLLPSSGAGSLELDVLLGHEMDSKETKVYVQNAERGGLAVSVMDKIDGISW